MNPREDLNRLLGMREEQIRQLERQRESLVACQADAREWARLRDHQQELGEWLIDQATNPNGDVVHSVIDAALGGELFVPGSFTASCGGRRYHFELVSTMYSVFELDSAG